jgi:hypothetical protein
MGRLRGHSRCVASGALQDVRRKECGDHGRGESAAGGAQAEVTGDASRAGFAERLARQAETGRWAFVLETSATPS